MSKTIRIGNQKLLCSCFFGNVLNINCELRNIMLLKGYPRCIELEGELKSQNPKQKRLKCHFVYDLPVNRIFYPNIADVYLKYISCVVLCDSIDR